MKRKTYLKPDAEPLGLQIQYMVLADTEQRIIQDIEDIEEVEGVELGSNTIKVWDYE